MKKLTMLLGSFTFLITSCGSANTTAPKVEPDKQLDQDKQQDNQIDTNQDNGQPGTNTPDAGTPDAGTQPPTNPTNPTTPTQSDSDIMRAAIGPDWISDGYEKDFTRKDMRVINELEDSVFSFSQGSDFIGYVNGAPINSSTCFIANQVNAPETNFPSIINVGGEAQKTEILDRQINANGQKIQIPRSIVGPETRYKTRGTSFVIDENATHYFIATNAHVAIDVIADTANPGKFISKVSDCVVFRSNDSRNISFSPDYSFNYNAQSLVQDNTSETNITDTIQNSVGAIFTGSNIGYNIWGNIAQSSVDLAILPVKKSDIKDHTGKQYQLKPLAFSNYSYYDTNTRRDDFYTVGYPYNTKRFNKTFSAYASGSSPLQDYLTGNDVPYSGTTRKYNNQFIKFKMWQQSGSSGSPVVNSKGELVGINTLLQTQQQYGGLWEQVSLALDIKHIKEVYTDYLCPLSKTKGLAMNKCNP